MPKDELFDFMGMLQAALGGDLIGDEPTPEELLAEVKTLPQRPGTTWLVVARDVPNMPVPDGVGQPFLLLMLDMQTGQSLMTELLEDVDQDEAAQFVMEAMLEPEDEEEEPYRPELIITPDAQTAFTLGNLLREAGIRVERDNPPGFEDMLKMSVGQLVQAVTEDEQARAPKPYLTGVSDDQIREYVQAFGEFMRLKTWNVLGPDKPLYAHWQNADGTRGQVYAVTMGELGESFGLALYPDWLAYVQHLENAQDQELVLEVLDGLEAMSQGGQQEFAPADWATLERLNLVKGRNPQGPSLLRIGLDGTKAPRTPISAITGILKVLNERASKKRAPASSLKGNADGVYVQFPGGPRDELSEVEQAGSVELVYQHHAPFRSYTITIRGAASMLMSQAYAETRKATKAAGNKDEYLMPFTLGIKPAETLGMVRIWDSYGSPSLTLAHLARLGTVQDFGGYGSLQITFSPSPVTAFSAQLSHYQEKDSPTSTKTFSKTEVSRDEVLKAVGRLSAPDTKPLPKASSGTPKAASQKVSKQKVSKQPQAMCRLCGYVGTKASMPKHQATCPERLKLGANLTRQPVYRLRVSGGGPYWLDVDMPENAKLDDLDGFLRGIWLECCGHMSEFDLGGRGSWGWDDAPKQDNRPISKILREGQKIGYTYDFGSSTNLEITVQAYENVPLPKKPQKVRLLARNLPPQWTCSECDQPAEWAHSWEYDDQTGMPLLFCAEHAQETDEEALLPVVNSPRMGVCAYEGGNDDEWPPAQNEV